MGREVPIRVLIIGTQEFERPVGEHNAEPKRGAARVLLDHPDLVTRIIPFH